MNVLNANVRSGEMERNKQAKVISFQLMIKARV